MHWDTISRIRELLVRALTHRSLAHELAQENGNDPGGCAGRQRAPGVSGRRGAGPGGGRSALSAASGVARGRADPRPCRLVSRQHMAQVAEAIGLGKHLRLSRGEERSGLRRKSTVLSNTMEAVMGALFLDGGLEPVRAFVAQPGDGRGCRASGRGIAFRRGAGQLQIGACRSGCRRRAPELPSTASRARAARTIASDFWSKCG